MRFYKLRVTPDAANKASMFNEQIKPEIIAEENDPFRTHWILESKGEEFLVGEKVSLGQHFSLDQVSSLAKFFQALLLSDPSRLGYTVRRPFYGTKFNTRDYPSNQMILDDVETIISVTLSDRFGIEARAYKVFYMPRRISLADSTSGLFRDVGDTRLL